MSQLLQIVLFRKHCCNRLVALDMQSSARGVHMCWGSLDGWRGTISIALIYNGTGIIPLRGS